MLIGFVVGVDGGVGGGVRVSLSSFHSSFPSPPLTFHSLSCRRYLSCIGSLDQVGEISYLLGGVELPETVVVDSQSIHVSQFMKY